MARTAAAYYVRVDTYWQNSPDRFAGPFESREAAQAEIDRAINEPDSNAWLAGEHCGGNIKYAVRIFPDILTATEAKRQGMRPLGALRGTNMIGERIPVHADDLYV
jgi:hypothetical protein